MQVTSFSVVPGESLTIPVLLHNQGTEDDYLELSVRGLPAGWVYLPSPAIQLAAGARREATLVVQPPGPPQGKAGYFTFVVRATRRSAPEQAAEVEGSLTVAAMEVQGRIGLLLAASEFSVVPGESVTIPVVLINHGLEDDVLQLRVEGIPVAWVTTTAATVRLAPGQQREVDLTIQPPRSAESRAGRGLFKIQIVSQAIPGQMTEAQCTLSVGVFTDFGAELHPRQLSAQQPGQVIVENHGNVPQTFRVTWQSTNDELSFEPAEPQELRVPPGEVTTVQFTAKPRQRPFFGAERSYPFITRVQSAAEGHKNLNGEALGRPLIPGGVVTAALVALVAIAALAIAVVLIGRVLDSDSGEAPQATATEVAVAPPVEPPVEPLPTEPPVEPPPTEQPPVEPPTEQPPVEPPPEEQPPTEQPPDEGDDGGSGLPCASAALPLLLVPLAVIGRKTKRTL
jgi:uncharacterized membrane protein